MHTLFHCTLTLHCKTPTTIITMTPFFEFKINNHQAHKKPLSENMHKLITFSLCWPCKVNPPFLINDFPSYARLDCFSFSGFLMRWRHPLKLIDDVFCHATTSLARPSWEYFFCVYLAPTSLGSFPFCRGLYCSWRWHGNCRRLSVKNKIIVNILFLITILKLYHS